MVVGFVGTFLKAKYGVKADIGGQNRVVSRVHSSGDHRFPTNPFLIAEDANACLFFAIRGAGDVILVHPSAVRIASRLVVV
jgi:hypothetical protein